MLKTDVFVWLTVNWFGNLSRIYDAVYFLEPCVTLEYLEPWYMQNLRNN